MSSQGSHLILGVDGGSTGTQAVLVDAETKATVGTGSRGSCNQNSVGATAARQNVQGAVLDALADAGLMSAAEVHAAEVAASAAIVARGEEELGSNPPEPPGLIAPSTIAACSRVRAICLGLSGVDRQHDREAVDRFMADLKVKDLKAADEAPPPPTASGTLPADCEVIIHNDAVAALCSGTLGALRGVVVISGTGMIAYGHNGTSESRCGGYGPLLGDRGSGYDIGFEVVKHALRGSDGRGPATPLLQAVLGKTGLERPSQLIDWCYKDVSWDRVAALAPLAFECAAPPHEDPVAQRIVKECAAELALAVVTVARKLGMGSSAKVEGEEEEAAEGKQAAPAAESSSESSSSTSSSSSSSSPSSSSSSSSSSSFELVLAGGVLEKSATYAAAVEEAVRAAEPGVQVVKQTVEPNMGAALLGLAEWRKLASAPHGSLQKQSSACLE
eukprot:g907.t1